MVADRMRYIRRSPTAETWHAARAHLFKFGFALYAWSILQHQTVYSCLVVLGAVNVGQHVHDTCRLEHTTLNMHNVEAAAASNVVNGCVGFVLRMCMIVICVHKYVARPVCFRSR